jgi:hypothetical protein
MPASVNNLIGTFYEAATGKTELLAHAAQQCPAQQRPGQHLLALHRASRRAGPDSARGIS